MLVGAFGWFSSWCLYLWKKNESHVFAYSFRLFLRLLVLYVKKKVKFRCIGKLKRQRKKTNIVALWYVSTALSGYRRIVNSFYFSVACAVCRVRLQDALRSHILAQPSKRLSLSYVRCCYCCCYIQPTREHDQRRNSNKENTELPMLLLLCARWV